MKPILLVLVVATCLAAGFAGAGLGVCLLGGGCEPAARDAAVSLAGPGPRAEAARAVPPAPAEPVPASGDLGASLAAVRDQLAVLEIEVASLREDLARRESTEVAAVAPAGATPDELAGLPREAIVRVLEEERQKEAQKREEERKQRELREYERLSERAAKDLGLAAADQQRLTTFLVAAGEKRDELFRGARDTGPEGVRTAFEELRVWREAELEKTFGKDLSQQLVDYQRRQRGDWGGAGGWWQGGDERGRDRGQGGSTQPSGRFGGR
jgi:hypothetical protein